GQPPPIRGPGGGDGTDASAAGEPAAVRGLGDRTDHRRTGGGRRDGAGAMTDRRRPFVADERGSGSMLTLMTVALTLMAFLVVLVVGSYLIADHRAVAAADRAALSGARAHGAPGGRQQEA